jgi:hypothetical protein
LANKKHSITIVQIGFENFIITHIANNPYHKNVLFYLVVFPKHTRPTLIWQIITHACYITYSLLTLLVLEKVKNQWKKVVSKPTMEKQNKQSQNNRKKN